LDFWLITKLDGFWFGVSMVIDVLTNRNLRYGKNFCIVFREIFRTFYSIIKFLPIHSLPLKHSYYDIWQIIITYFIYYRLKKLLDSLQTKLQWYSTLFFFQEKDEIMAK